MLYVANIGDARCLIANKDSQDFKQVTTDHTPDLIDEYIRIKSSGSYVTDGRVEGKLNLSRAFGDLKYK